MLLESNQQPSNFESEALPIKLNTHLHHFYDKQDLNLWPLDFKSTVLPIELLPHICSTGLEPATVRF